MRLSTLPFACFLYLLGLYIVKSMPVTKRGAWRFLVLRRGGWRIAGVRLSDKVKRGEGGVVTGSVGELSERSTIGTYCQPC